MNYYLRGEIAKQANINIETLRYYEKNKIIPIPVRTKNGYRQYSEKDLNRLQFIIQVKECGFSLEEIRQMFPIEDMNMLSMTDALSVIDNKVADIEEKILKLKKIQSLLIEIKNEIIEPKCPEIQSIMETYMRIKK